MVELIYSRKAATAAAPNRPAKAQAACALAPDTAWAVVEVVALLVVELPDEWVEVAEVVELLEPELEAVPDAEALLVEVVTVKRLVALPVGLAVEAETEVDGAPRVTCEVLYAVVTVLSRTKYGVKFVLEESESSTISTV
jgi:hypothetical protein